MDTAGAAVLKLRIKQQEHWRLAVSVCNGRQAQIDPDLNALLEMRGSERCYREAQESFVKRLIGGEWVRAETASPGARADADTGVRARSV
ncbi:MAG: hypothetical protein EXQ81_10310 [Thermoleophilia bacterium]|nr:hypothetical protein [Thermoleophilia bacterium]